MQADFTNLGKRRAQIGKIAFIVMLLLGSVAGCSKKETAAEKAPAKTDAPAKTTAAPVEKPADYVETTADPLALVQAKTELEAIRRRIVENRGMTKPIVAQLAELHNRFPRDEQVADLLVRGHTQFQNWSDLADVLLEIPAARRTTVQHQQLGGALIRARRYDDAFNILDSLVDAEPENLDLVSLVADAAFKSKHYDRAASLLDANWSKLLAVGSVRAKYQRAMIHMERGESEKAVAMLNTVLAEAPTHTGANDALGEWYKSNGETARAEEYINAAKTQRAHYSRPEDVELYLLEIGQQMSAAWANKQYSRCEDFITEFLPYATGSERVILYEFQAQVFEALGKRDLATLARSKAELAAKEVRDGKAGSGTPNP